MKCIYDCGLPLNLVKSPLFKDMIEECIEYDIKLKVPAYYEARVIFCKNRSKIYACDVREVQARMS
jgi:hypothetical protein